MNSWDRLCWSHRGLAIHCSIKLSQQLIMKARSSWSSQISLMMSNFLNNSKLYASIVHWNVLKTDFCSSLMIGTPYHPLGCLPTKCKLLKKSEKICCLELNGTCEHRPIDNEVSKLNEYKWNSRCIILVAEHATNGLSNFILPLRSKVRSTVRLKPIILLLKNKWVINWKQVYFIT